MIKTIRRSSCFAAIALYAGNFSKADFSCINFIAISCRSYGTDMRWIYYVKNLTSILGLILHDTRIQHVMNYAVTILAAFCRFSFLTASSRILNF